MKRSILFSFSSAVSLKNEKMKKIFFSFFLTHDYAGEPLFF